MIKNYDESAQINGCSNRPYIPKNFYKFLVIGDLESDKTNVFITLINFVYLSVYEN